MNYIVQKDQKKLELAQYLHACAFSLSIKTLQACIRKENFVLWPGIDEINIDRILKTTLATAK